MSSLTKGSSESAPALKLPAELWLLIFEFVTALSIDPAGYCNHLNFPHIDRHHRFPCDYPSVISPSLRVLRYVCWYFNALLQPSASFYMNDSNSAIPATTRALYITSKYHYTLHARLQRLFTDPSISGRIIIFNLVESHLVPTTDLNFLLDNASSLPAVRTLALCLHTRIYGAYIPRFWGRLNEGFPHLSCLILHGVVETTHPDVGVEFKNLVVLDWDYSNPHTSLIFPRLRHVAFGALILFGPEKFARWPHLESLVLRTLNRRARFDWSLFPNLKLLGLPAQRVGVFPPLPPNHPLEHLYIFVGTRPRDDHNRHLFDYDLQLTWLKQTICQLPTVTRISLWFDKTGQNQHRWIEGDFREDDLKLLGFEDLMFLHQNPRDGSHRVLQRLKDKAKHPHKILTTEGLVPRRAGFRTAWNMLARFISRSMQL